MCVEGEIHISVSIVHWLFAAAATCSRRHSSSSPHQTREGTAAAAPVAMHTSGYAQQWLFTAVAMLSSSSGCAQLQKH